MNTLLERGKAAQLKDVREQRELEKYSSSGVPPDIAAVKVIKREGFQLSEFIKDSLSAPALTR